MSIHRIINKSEDNIANRFYHWYRCTQEAKNLDDEINNFMKPDEHLIIPDRCLLKKSIRIS